MISQLTKATNVLLHLQQRLRHGWPPPSDDGAVCQQFFNFSSSKLVSLSTFTSGSESSGGVIVRRLIRVFAHWGEHDFDKVQHRHLRVGEENFSHFERNANVDFSNGVFALDLGDRRG